jgi:hypothetical protein
MQSPSRSPSPISVNSNSLYHPAQVLCNTNGTPVDLTGLYCQQQQLAIHSTPPHTQPRAQMSSIASYNASNESPNESPIQLSPQLALMPAPITLSPHTVQTTLQAQPDIDTTLLQSIANRLLQTITNRETDTTITKKAYEDRIHHLEQCILHYEDTFNHAPKGFVLNNRQVSNFHIPVGNGLYQEAKWIHLNNNSTVAGYHAQQGLNQQPYIIDLYATPDCIVDSPINSLPAWFRHLLTSPGGKFQILQTTVADTDDWGLAQEITWYREINDNVTYLVVKIEEYQHDLNATWASLMSCKSRLMLAHAAECIETLHNVPRKTGAICLGWKRATGCRSHTTYVQGRPF